MTAIGSYSVKITLDQTKLVPFATADLLTTWTDVAETELFCEIDNIEHSCTYNSGQNTITIVISTDVPAAEHFYKISHKGVLDKTKGGFHLGSDSIQISIQVEIYQTATNVESIISPPLYINKQSLGQANFKLSDYAHLVAAEFNYLTFSFTTSTVYTMTKFILEFPYQEY